MGSISMDRLSFTASSTSSHPAVMLTEWQSEDRRSRIVFMTRDMDEPALRDLLEMFETGKVRQPKTLPVESGDSDVAIFEAPR